MNMEDISVDEELYGEKILVLYGSQTGTAKECAKRVVREGLMRWFDMEWLSLEDYNMERIIHDKILVFILSTAGQGEVPENMKKFWKILLRKSLPSNLLDDVKFTVFGLGDSSYPLFNAAARKLYQRMLNLGAKPFYKRGLGDDQHKLGYDTTFIPWLKGLWDKLSQMCPLKGKELIDRSTIPPPIYKCIIDKESEFDCSVFLERKESKEKVLKGVFGEGMQKYFPVLAKIEENRSLTTEDHFQDVRHIELKINDLPSLPKYKPGDVVCVFPRNPADISKKFIKFVLKEEPNNFVKIKKKERKPNKNFPSKLTISLSDDLGFPECVTLLDLISVYLDINGTPTRDFFLWLSYFDNNELEKEKLKELASEEGIDLYYEYCVREKRTYYEVFEEFKSAEVPLCYLIEMIPRITPRQFSISSSPLAHETLHITVAVVDYLTPYKRRKLGLCSNWLASLKQEDFIPICIVKGSVNFDNLFKGSNLLLIGPGTGMAMFRSICHELNEMRLKVIEKNIYLFLGHRYSNKDYLYENEWKELLRTGPVKHLSVAFSRQEGQYVQDKLLEESHQIWNILKDQNTVIIVSGNSKSMPEDVKNTLIKIVNKNGGMDEKSAISLVKGFIRKHRYIVEAW